MSSKSSTEKANYNVKILLLGDGGVGKTAIRRRFMGQGFKSVYMETIGSDFSTKTVEFEDNLTSVAINFQIWDLAGQPKFQNIRQMFYAGSQGAIFVFDLTRLDSLENIKLWINEVKNNGISHVPSLLIGNKVDLKDEGIPICDTESDLKISEVIHTVLNDNEVSVNTIRTSAKTGYNIDQAFELLAKEIYFQISGSH